MKMEKLSQNRSRFIFTATTLFVASEALPTFSDAMLAGYAFVQDDGSLKISGQTVYLCGIYVPPTALTCYTFIRPPSCGTRAALALDFKIGVDCTLHRKSRPARGRHNWKLLSER